MERRTFLGSVGLTALGACSEVSGTAIGATAENSGERRGVDRANSVTATDADWTVAWNWRWPYGAARSSVVQVVEGGERLFLTPRIAGYDGIDQSSTDDDVLALGVGRADGSHETDGQIEVGALSPAPAGAVRVDGGFVFAGLADERDHTRVSRLPTADDRGYWEVRLDGAPGGPPATGGDAVLVPAGETLVALSVSDGERRWTAGFDAPVTGVAATGEAVYVTTGDGVVSRVAATTGTRRWSVGPAERGPLRGPTVAGDRVLALDEWGGVHAVETGGAAAWSTVPDGVATPADHDYLGPDDAPGTTGRVAADGDRCYVATVLGRDDRERTAVAALSLTDGTETWTFEFASAPHTDSHSVRRGPALQPRATRAGVWAVGRRTAVALDAATGDLRRRWGLGGVVTAPPLPTADAVYLFDEVGAYRLDRSSGCGPLSVSGANATYRNRMGDRELAGEASLSAGDCPAVGTVELWADGAFRGAAGRYLPVDGGESPSAAVRWRDFPRSVDRVALRFRGTDGTVFDSRTVAVDDYRDDPGEFALVCPSVRAYDFGIGSRVETSVEVVNYGFDEGFVLSLVADGEVVARQRGSVGKRVADEPAGCGTNTVTLSHTFYGFGSHDLGLRVGPRGDAGEGDTADLDSVSVGNPGALGTLGAVGALGAGYLGWQAKRSDGRRRGRSRRER